MQYTASYPSPIGGILLAANEYGLTGLWFEGEKFYALSLDPAHEEKETPVLAKARRWLDIYFSGTEPDSMPPVHAIGSDFQLCVWQLLREIPYGKTIFHGELAKQVARKRGLPRMSAQAVGGAGTMESPSLCPATALLGQTEALPGMPVEWEKTQTAGGA